MFDQLKRTILLLIQKVWILVLLKFFFTESHKQDVE